MPSLDGALKRPSVKTPYLRRLESFVNAFPALNSFLEQLLRDNDPGREAVKGHYSREHRGGPGRCYCLTFEERSVWLVNEEGFKNAATLRTYIEQNPATHSRNTKNASAIHVRKEILERP